MAAIDNIRTAAVTQPFGGFSETFRNMVTGLKTWNDIRLTRKALEALSDRELADIGMIRGDIFAAAARSVH